MTLNESQIRKYRFNLHAFAFEQFGMTPDLWQSDVFDAVVSGDPAKQRISLQACVGPGKTAVLAIIGWWFLTVWGTPGNHPKGAAVSVTEDNLNDNLWPEFAKWRSRSPLIMEMFEWTKTRIFAKDHPETWFISARTYSKTADPEEQGRTLSGLHSDYVLALVDESGEVPPAVLRAAEQALSTNPIFGKIIQAGNPSSLEGALYAAASTLAHLWHVVRITGDPDDPKRSPRINIDWARQQIATYGRDNPWIMYSILGLFPPSSINSLLSPDEVRAAMARHLRPDMYNWSQKRIGVDVARFGDDRTVIFPRQGLAAFKPVEMRNARTPDIAARVVLAKKTWRSECEFVDGTGGFGAGVIDSMIAGGYSPFEINFSGKALDPRYYNKRSEIHFELAKWIKRGGALPNIPELVRELTAPTYTLHKGMLRVEEKDQIKKRLGFSPDYADALALTFSHPDAPSSDSLQARVDEIKKHKTTHDYDPIKRFEEEIKKLHDQAAQIQSGRGGHMSEYDPHRAFK